MQLLGREITDLVEIGQDPFGRVFRGLWSERAVAVRSAEAFEPWALPALGDLSESVTHVRHQALPTYYGVGMAKHPFLVMEFIDGLALSQVLDEGTAVLPIDRLRCTQHLSGALAEIHQAGMAHGCVTARNVLMGPDDVHLVDMTFVAPSQEAAPRRYRAPEAATVTQDTEERIKRDLYGLGAVLFEIGTGHTYPGVFRADDLGGTDLEPVASIVARLLDPDPVQRYGHAREAFEDLARVLGDAEPTTARLQGVAAAPTQDYEQFSRFEDKLVEIARPFVEAALEASVADSIAEDALGDAAGLLASIAGRKVVSDPALRAEVASLGENLQAELPVPTAYVDWRSRQVGGLLASHWIGLIRECLEESRGGSVPLADYLMPWPVQMRGSLRHERQCEEFAELVAQLVVDQDAVNAIFEALHKELEESAAACPLPGGLRVERSGDQLLIARAKG